MPSREPLWYPVWGIVVAYGQDCYLCGAQVFQFHGPESLVIDHVLPLSQGGCQHMANLRPVHAICNRLKGDKLLSEFADWLERRWAWSPTAQVPIAGDMYLMAEGWLGLLSDNPCREAAEVPRLVEHFERCGA
jgi:hypothetical protein